MPPLRKGEMPPSVGKHPCRDEIDKRLLRGDSILSVVKWLKSIDEPVSRPTLTRYHEWLMKHKEVAFIENGGRDMVSINRAEGAALAEINEMSALNNVIREFENVDWTQVSESEKVRYGLQAIGVKQNILADRQDLKDERRIDMLEQLMQAVLKNELRDVLVGLKDEIRKEKLKEESIDAEYEVKE